MAAAVVRGLGSGNRSRRNRFAACSRGALVVSAFFVGSLVGPVYAAQSAHLLDRSVSDRPDDKAGPQIHIVYAIPSDGVDRQLDINGIIAASVASWENWLASQTLAAKSAVVPTRWCGTETSVDQPDVVGGNQVHVIYAYPSDGPDRFGQWVLPIVRDLAYIDQWWRLQDPTRTPRFDLALFPGCDTQFGQIDVSSLRLSHDSGYYSASGTDIFNVIGLDLATSFPSRYKKYLVYYDGPISINYCGFSPIGLSGFTGGMPPSVVFLQGSGCSPTGNDGWGTLTAAHELLHNLGAVQGSAPHNCDGAHVCDNSADIMFVETTSAITLGSRVLDYGRDDYYGTGHGDDVRNSPYLAHLDAPQYSLNVSVSGNGTVTSDLPGVNCAGSCSSQWDAGTQVTLEAKPQSDDYVFTGWSGACAGKDEVCIVTMNQAQSVSASFVQMVTLTVKVARKTPAANGAVKLPNGALCRNVCVLRKAPGTKVVLTAVPAKGSRLLHWLGGLTGTKAAGVIVLKQNVTVVAVFAKAPKAKKA